LADYQLNQRERCLFPIYCNGSWLIKDLNEVSQHLALCIRSFGFSWASLWIAALPLFELTSNRRLSIPNLIV
jgi:hypothetical protein